MKETLRASLVLLGVMTVLTGLVYPYLVLEIAQLAMPWQANGSMIEIDGKPAGSTWVGQPFSRPEFFWGRPSATATHPYHAASSGGSNLGPLNPALAKNVADRIAALRKFDPEIKNVPVDLVTASGSGLDPHISPQAAEVQIRRVAAARHRSEDEVRTLVRQHTEGPQFGMLGEPVVHVLKLNLALDQSGGKPANLGAGPR